MWKRTAIIFAILSILLISAILYVKMIFLPVQLRKIVFEKSRAFLNREMVFDDLSFRPFKGVIIKNLKIFQKENPQLPFITIDEADFNVLLLSILTEKKIIISSMSIEGAAIHLIRNDDGSWNFSDLLPSKNIKRSSSGPPVLLGKLNLQNITVQLEDRTSLLTSIDTFHLQEGRIALSVKKGIRYNLVLDIPDDGSTLSVTGSFTPLSKNLNANIQISSLNVKKYLDRFYPDSRIELQTGLIDRLDLDADYRNETLKLAGSIALRSEGRFGPHPFSLPELRISGLKFKKEKDRMEGMASIKSAGSRWQITENKILSGDLDTGPVRFLFENGELDLKSPESLCINNTSFHLMTTDVSGDITALGFHFHKKANILTGSAQGLSMGNSNITWAEERYVKGNIALENVRFTSDLNLSKVDAVWGGDNLLARLGDEIFAGGSLRSDPASLEWKTGYVNLTAPGLSLTDSGVSFNGGRTINGSHTTENFSLLVENKNVALTTTVRSSRMEFLPDKKSSFTGQTTIKLDLNYAADEKNLTYSGDLMIVDGSLPGHPRLGDVTGINGYIKYKNDFLETADLRFQLFGIPVLASGSLQNFDHPALSMSAKGTSLDLEEVFGIISRFKDDLPVTGQGHADAVVSYDGPVRSINDSTYRISAKLMNASIAFKKFPETLQDLNGDILIKNNSVTWSNLTGVRQNQNFSSHGSVNGFANPLIEGKFSSGNLSLAGRLKWYDDTLQVSNLTGSYYDSDFSADGFLSIKNGKVTSVDLNGGGTLELSNLVLFSPDLNDKLKSFDLKGRVTGSAGFKGPLESWREASITVSAKAPKFSTGDVTFRNASLTWNQGRGRVSQCTLTSSAYGGSVNLEGHAQFRETEDPFDLSLQIKDVDLKEFRESSKWKDKQFSGFLSAAVDLNGSLRALDRVRGGGSLTVLDGELAQMKLLKGIWAILLIPEFEEITFTEGRATFMVKDGRAMTDDLTLVSQPVHLFGEGWIDFQKSIHLDITPKFMESEILRSNSMKKGITALLTTADSTITIRVTGTLDQPRFEKKILPGKIIKKTFDSLIEGGQGLLEEILQ